MKPPPLQIGTPCPQRWEQMSGDSKRRFCEPCQLHVHNLSAMSARERDRFVEETAGRECIAYQLRPDGTMVTPSFWRAVLLPFQRFQISVLAVLAAVLPFWFSACASRRTLGKPVSNRACPPGGLPGESVIVPGKPMPVERTSTKKSQ